MCRAFGRRSGLVFTAVAGLTLCACSQSSSSNAHAGETGRTSAEAAKAPGASSIDACHLLTKNEIQQQLGGTVADGKLQTTNSQASCDWDGSGGGVSGFGITVQDFDQSLWSTLTASARAVPISGLGDAAFAHVPTSIAVMIKQGQYEVDVGVVNFKKSNDEAIAEDKALAALILARLPGSANGAK